MDNATNDDAFLNGSRGSFSAISVDLRLRRTKVPFGSTHLRGSTRLDITPRTSQTTIRGRNGSPNSIRFNSIQLSSSISHIFFDSFLGPVKNTKRERDTERVRQDCFPQPLIMPGRKQPKEDILTADMGSNGSFDFRGITEGDGWVECCHDDSFGGFHQSVYADPPKPTISRLPPEEERHANKNLRKTRNGNTRHGGRNSSSGSARGANMRPDPAALEKSRSNSIIQDEENNDNNQGRDVENSPQTSGKPTNSDRSRTNPSTRSRQQKQQQQQGAYWAHGLPPGSEDVTLRDSGEWTADDSDEKDRKEKHGLALCCCLKGCFCSIWQICLLVTIFLLLIIMGIGGGVAVGVFGFRSDSTSSANVLATFAPSLSIQPTMPPSSIPSVSPTTSSEPSKGPTTSPSASPSASPTEFPTFRTIPPSNITVGVYYYPWHAVDFHNGGGYVRRVIGQAPLLGEYDDRSPATIQRHLAWSRQANIRMWISSWWGPGRVEDTTLRDVILNHRDIGDHKIALLYESSNRIQIRRNVTTRKVADDIRYMAETYFDHPNYYRIDGRPVLFVYVTRKLEEIGVLTEVLLQMRGVAAEMGHNIYLVGDHAFDDAPKENEWFPAFLYLDAVSNYDMYGSMGGRGGYAGNEGVANYFRDQKDWRRQAHLNGCAFIPGISPGFNDRGVRLQADHKPLSRKLTADDEFGSLFRAVTREARWLVDMSTSHLMIVNSFNEWHEDTQIEPAVGDTTNVPFDHTQGLDYEGYGTRYLDILREETEDLPE